MKNILKIFTFLLLFSAMTAVIFAQDISQDEFSKKADAAVKLADEMHLAENPYWRTLLHYKPSVLGHYKSLIDDPSFFFANKGKTNPEAELEATIRAFFEPKIEGEAHATARFPGRYAWIRQQLNLDTSDFPYDGDVEYHAIIDVLKPGEMYLVFPAGYMKNPASVFGHTFMLVESEELPRLLASSVNYGAVTSLNVGFLYAILGLVGGFHGYYGFEPYYEKIKKYANMDMRDMWEYHLNFTPEERDRLMRHIIDMTAIYSNYFFISENCSYNLLFLIEAARPETKITDAISGVVEPIETIKTIEKLGVSDDFTFRPSLYQRIETQKSYLTKKQNKYVKDLCLGKKTVEDFIFTELSAEKQAVLWNLATDYLQYLLNNRRITSEEYRPRYISVLSARRKLGKVDEVVQPEVPVAPHLAHGSKKIALEGGKDIGGAYLGLNFRLTAHEQLESSAGYSENSQLAFLNIDARYRFFENEFYLKKALIADVISLPASDLFIFNSAFHATFGFETNADEDKNEDLAFRTKFLFGASAKPADCLQLYLLAGPDAYFNTSYDYNTDLLLGGETGFITTFGSWKNKIEAGVFQSPLDFDHFRATFSAQEAISVSQNMMLLAECSFNIDYDNYWPEWKFAFNAYF